MNVSSNSVTQTVEFALDHYKKHKAVTLVAQMQSGKTNTFFEIAKEMLKAKMVKRVVIFSGNNETLLKKQTLERVEEDPVLQYVCDVVFGSDLPKFQPELMTKTLYIWDESHYGQSDDQRVDKFCAKCGICPAGVDNTIISTVYTLFVSATPFSEVIDAKHSNKLVIFQTPSVGYYGISDMLANKKIHTFNDFDICAYERIMELKSSRVPKVGLVRLREYATGPSKFTILENLCKQNNLTIKLYDASSNDDELIQAIESKPLSSHVVVVKGKLRMGRTIEDKRNVLWAWETSEMSKADTRMQGFLGRFCGYNNISKGLHQNLDIDFWIHEKSGNAPNEYVNYFATLGRISPKSGMNITYHSKGRPIYKTFKFPDSAQIEMQKAKTSGLRSVSMNEICQELSIPDFPETLLDYRFFKRNEKMVFKENEVPYIPSGQGAAFNKEANIYTQCGEYWMLYAIDYIPAGTGTTKEEIFAKPLKHLYANGFMIGGPRMSSYSNASQMSEDILGLIRATKQTKCLQKKIQGPSQMTKEVYKALVSGIIHKQIKKQEKVVIQIPNVISETKECVVVDEINW